MILFRVIFLRRENGASTPSKFANLLAQVFVVGFIFLGLSAKSIRAENCVLEVARIVQPPPKSPVIINAAGLQRLSDLIRHPAILPELILRSRDFRGWISDLLRSAGMAVKNTQRGALSLTSDDHNDLYIMLIQVLSHRDSEAAEFLEQIIRAGLIFAGMAEPLQAMLAAQTTWQKQTAFNSFKEALGVEANEDRWRRFVVRFRYTNLSASLLAKLSATAQPSSDIVISQRTIQKPAELVIYRLPISADALVQKLGDSYKGLEAPLFEGQAFTLSSFVQMLDIEVRLYGIYRQISTLEAIDRFVLAEREDDKQSAFNSLLPSLFKGVREMRSQMWKNLIDMDGGVASEDKLTDYQQEDLAQVLATKPPETTIFLLENLRQSTVQTLLDAVDQLVTILGDRRKFLDPNIYLNQPQLMEDRKSLGELIHGHAIPLLIRMESGKSFQDGLKSLSYRFHDSLRRVRAFCVSSNQHLF